MKKAEIRFVREYNYWNTTWYDVIYKSGRLCMHTAENLPKTVREYIDNASKKTTQFDRTFKRDEIIYEA